MRPTIFHTALLGVAAAGLINVTDPFRGYAIFPNAAEITNGTR